MASNLSDTTSLKTLKSKLKHPWAENMIGSCNSCNENDSIYRKNGINSVNTNRQLKVSYQDSYSGTTAN